MNNELIIPPFDVKMLEQRMRPGFLSQGGFLGYHESLISVLSEDDTALEQLNLTYGQVSNRLESLLKLAITNGNKYSDNDFKIVISQYAGFQICPWTKDPNHEQCRYGQGAEFASIDWKITNRKTNFTRKGPGLAVHLIGDHHFFQGKESPYRVSPQDLIKLLNL